MAAVRIVRYTATAIFLRILLSRSTVINPPPRQLHSLRYWYYCTYSRLNQNERTQIKYYFISSRIGQRNEVQFDVFRHSVQMNFRKASSNRS